MLQVLALVQRRGPELGGEAAELGRLAGEQERALRELIRAQDAVTTVQGDATVDLAAELARLEGRTVTVATPAGSYPSTCFGAADSNYTISYQLGTITVGPAPLSIAASSGTMTYGGTVPTITPSYSGFVNGDSAASLTTPPTCGTAATSSSASSSHNTR